jgi:hypothetical protein
MASVQQSSSLIELTTPNIFCVTGESQHQQISRSRQEIGEGLSPLLQG